MSDQELMFALQCCAPNHKSERNCYECPFNGDYMCHTELCESAIDFITRTVSHMESISHELDSISQLVDNISSHF